MSDQTRQWDASDYSRNSTAQLTWARELLAKLRLQSHEHVLDVGCGDGKVTVEIAASVPDGLVVGIDSSLQMIGFAQQNFPAADYPNLRFQPGDARKLGLDEEFDVVFSNAVLHWILDHRPVLRGIAKALRPGGRCLLQMGGQGNATAILQTFERLRQRPEFAEYFVGMGQPYGFHGPEEYHVWLEGAGLVPERVELIPKTMTHQGRDGLAGWVRTTWLPYLDRLPEELRPSLVDAVVDGYLAEHPIGDDGLTRVEMVRLEVAACRP